MKMKSFEAIAEALALDNVEVMFGLMTSDNMALLTHLERRGVAIIRARTEHGAVCMADGYSRATGRLGVVSIGAGPSAAMAATALMTARRKRSRVAVICGEVPLADRYHLKRFDQEGFFLNTAGHCLTVNSLKTLIPDTYHVLRLARSGGPAVLNVPVDLLESEIDMDDIGTNWRYMVPTVVPAPAKPSDDAVAQAADMLANAERPLILAGLGAIEADAGAAALECAGRIGALLGTSLQAQHYFDDDFCVGIVGGLGLGLSMELVDQADVVLGVGASLNVYTSSFGQLFPNAKLIQIDNRPDAFGRMMPVDLPILGDARLTLEAINRQLADSGVAGRVGFRTEDARGQIRTARSTISPVPEAQVEKLDPNKVFRLLQEVLPPERVDVVDAGHFMYFVVDYLKTISPKNRIWTADFASIGLSVASGIGAAVANPEGPVVIYVGDGGFMMSLLELDSAVRHALPVVVIVLNDEAYGAEVRYLENRGVDYKLACFPSPDIATVVSGLGCEARTVRSLAELRDACCLIGTCKKPLVIDVRIDVTVAHRHLSARVGSAAASS